MFTPALSIHPRLCLPHRGLSNSVTCEDHTTVSPFRTTDHMCKQTRTLPGQNPQASLLTSLPEALLHHSENFPSFFFPLCSMKCLKVLLGTSFES